MRSWMMGFVVYGVRENRQHLHCVRAFVQWAYIHMLIGHGHSQILSVAERCSPVVARPRFGCTVVCCCQWYLYM